MHILVTFRRILAQQWIFHRRVGVSGGAVPHLCIIVESLDVAGQPQGLKLRLSYHL